MELHIIECHSGKLLKPPYPYAPCSYAECGVFELNDTELADPGIELEDASARLTASPSMANSSAVNYTTLFQKFVADCSSIWNPGSRNDTTSIETCMWANFLTKGMFD